MRSSTFVLAAILFFSPFAFSQEGHHHALTEQEVGSVHFSTSCRADLSGSFNRAVALLHSFQYEQARQAFVDIASQDPQCAMAQWGVAMSYYHGLWENGDLVAGRVALNQAKQVAALAAIPARYAIELGDWEQASQLRAREDIVPWAQAITWTAIGVGSARSKKLDRASQAEQQLATLRDAIAKQNNSYWSNQVEVQRREVAAWIAEQNGKPADALQLARSATELEESMDKSPVTPGAITPAREILAELLLLEHHPKESLAEYQNVLKTAPNRFDALYGAAGAAEASGDASLASNYLRKLTEVAVGDERPELSTARKRLVAEKH